MRLFAASLVLALATAVVGEAAVLEDVEVRGEGAVVVRLRLSAPAGVLARTLAASEDAPDRIYIDVSDAALASDAPRLVEGRGPVRRVRCAQHDPQTVRVVLDLIEPLPFRVIPDGRVVSLEVADAVPAELRGDAWSPPRPPPPREASPRRPEPPPSIVLPSRPPTDARPPLAPLSRGTRPPLPRAARRPEAPSRLAALSAAAMPPLPTPPEVAPETPAPPAAPPALATAAPPVPAPPPPEVRTPAPPPPPKRRERRPLLPPETVVVVDAGHGGRDPGAAGVGGVLEKDVVLAISQLFAERLLARLPVSVLLTRADDSFVPIGRRLPLNDDGAVVFVSLHANACPDASARGLEVFYGGGQVRGVSTDGTDSRAALLGRTLSNALGARVGGVRGDPRPGGFHVLVHNPAPSALVEVAYLTHPEEAALAQDPAYQALLADALVDGVEDFLRAASLHL